MLRADVSTQRASRGWIAILAGLFIGALAPITGAAENADPDQAVALNIIRNPEVSAPATPSVVNVDLRELPQREAWKPGDPIRNIPQRWFAPTEGQSLAPTFQIDPLLDAQRSFANRGGADPEFGIPSHSVGGIGFSGVNPPDTVGDIGPNYYIQSVNSGSGALIRVLDKQSPVPNTVSSFTLDQLGTTPQCSAGFGDPIILYDRQAGRWMLTEFSGNGNALCVYISQTGDPITGGWFAYTFVTPSFPDYPKFAVWATDANGGDGSYIVTANDGGPGVYALDRGSMLTGGAATFQRLAMPGLAGFGVQGPTPAEPDGPLGPVEGEAAIIMRHRDTEIHGGPGGVAGDVLEMWRMQVDWDNAANTTLIQSPNIEVADFSSELCGNGFTQCFDQPTGSTRLMPIQEVIYNRLQYYNHETYETLVASHVVDVDGTNRGGMRWYELRRQPGGNWELEQQGTFSQGNPDRWMGSIAMDQSGNIAMAYSTVSEADPEVFHSLRYTGRLAGDPPGVMTQPETDLTTGSGSNSSFRNGDYSAMTLDPEDDCTFWFTAMNNFTSNWRTHVGAFKFQACGCLVQPLAPVVTADEADDFQIDVRWNDSELDTIIEYRVGRSRTPGGPFEIIAVVEDNNPGTANGPDYLFEDTTISGGIDYYYSVIASDGSACANEPTNEVVAATDGACILPPDFGGASAVQFAVEDTCAINVSWDPASTPCDGDAAYNVYRSLTPNFTPDASNLVASGVVDTSIVDVNALIEGETYYYVIRSVDIVNGQEDGNSVEVTAEAVGPGTGIQTILSEDFEDPASFAADWTVSTGPGPHRCGEFVLAGSGTQRPAGGEDDYALALSQDCQPLLPLTSTSLDSPVMDFAIPGIRNVTLNFELFYNHFDGDDATVEAFDGANWVVLWADGNTDFNDSLSFDVTSIADGNANFQVRFNYQRANNDRWYAVDNVVVLADIENPCFTSATVAPIPDGAPGTTPLLADRADLSGSSIDLNWDAATCGGDFNLIFGDLNQVGSYAISGSECGLPSGGSFSWSSVPATDLYYLIVGSDPSGIESSWGQASFGERNGVTPSGECGVSFKEVTATCP